MSRPDPFAWIEECRPTRRHLRRQASHTAIAALVLAGAVAMILAGLRWLL